MKKVVLAIIITVTVLMSAVSIYASSDEYVLRHNDEVLALRYAMLDRDNAYRVEIIDKGSMDKPYYSDCDYLEYWVYDEEGNIIGLNTTEVDYAINRVLNSY